MRLGFLYPQILLSLVFGLILANVAEAQKKSLQQSASVTQPDSKKSKFDELLETKDLSKFRGYTTEEIGPGWSLNGKELVFDGSGEGDIITVETYSDFELQVEWMVEKGGNSGIMFRVTLGDDQPYMSGPEIQILDDENAKDGASELTSAGALYGLYPAEEKTLNPAGKWNRSKITVKDDKITHYLNSKKVFEAVSGSEDWNERLAKSKFKDWEKFNKAKEGHIAFQNHGDPVKFRSIRIKRLDADSKEDQGEQGGINMERGAPGLEPPGGEAAPGGRRRR